MNENVKLIALVGMPGAGKSVAASFFRDKGLPVLRFGDQTDIGLKELGLPLTEANERKYREDLRAELGMAAMAIKIEPRIQKALEESNKVVLDGLYSWEEYVHLEKKFPSIELLCIYARPETRYNRLANRVVRSLGRKEAESRDVAEIENLNKGGPIARADYLIINEGTEEEFRFSLTKTVRIALGARILFVAMTIGFCAFVFFGLRFYAADIVFAKAQTVPIKATEAFSLNPYRAEYAVSASQFYFQNVLSELQKSKSSQDSSIISANATLAIRYGTFAQNLAYDRAAIAGTLAFEYENLSFVGGSQDWAIKLYQHAILLEPTNPVLYNELGKLYSLKSDFSEAEKQFTAALALSPRYEDTWVAQALLFEKEGDADRATKQMQDVVGAYPADPNVLFQLGRMYFNSNKISMAIDEFTQALQLNPTFSNAHFALAAAYEKQGDKKQAISEYKKVLQLNPDNTEVAQKLKSL